MPDVNPDLLDPISLDQIRSGDPIALTDAIDRLYRGLNANITRLAQLSQQSALNPFYCRLTRNAIGSQTIPTATDTWLQWATPAASNDDVVQGVNIGGMFDPANPTLAGANGNNYVQIPEPGVYFAAASVQWDANLVGTRVVNIELVQALGDCLTSTRLLASGAGAGGLIQTTTTLVTFPIGASLNWHGALGVRVVQDSGGDRAVASLSTPLFTHWFIVARVAAFRQKR